ncbi:MAG: hypothetical protein ACFFD2_26100 [Promethearchaeota archaeon]
MKRKRKVYVTAQEIDGMTGIKSPHARELEELGKSKVDLFVKNKNRRIKIIVETQLDGKVENLGFDENYTVTFEFFPEVRSHLLFFNYENEKDEALGGSEIKFLFSGERVMWVPTEDSISLLDTTLEYLENILSNSQEIHGLKGEKTDLLKMAINQRKEPFNYLKIEQLDDLSTFIGAEIDQKNGVWVLSKRFFEGITVLLIYDMENNSLDIGYEGEHLIKMNNYARDQLGIFLMNHCLRFISVTYPKIQMPKIVKQCFSFSYIKSHF